MNNWYITTGKGSSPFWNKKTTVLEAEYMFYSELEQQKIPKIEIIRKNYSALSVSPLNSRQPSPFTEYRLTVNGVDKSLVEIGGDWLVFNVKDGRHFFEKGFSLLRRLFDWYLTEKKEG